MRSRAGSRSEGSKEGSYAAAAMSLVGHERRLRLVHTEPGSHLTLDIVRHRSESTLRAMSRHRDRHSISSSARARNVRENVRPIALAVLRLIAVSTLVGKCTGNSLILAPRRMRSM